MFPKPSREIFIRFGWTSGGYVMVENLPVPYLGVNPFLLPSSDPPAKR